MLRFATVLLLASFTSVLLRADTFDRYTNSVISQGTSKLQPVAKITAEEIGKHAGLLPDHGGVLVVFKSNEGHWGKLLLQLARQKKGEKQFAMALVERLTTYKPGQERAILASSNLVQLYDGFCLNADLAQIVPADLGGDLRFVAEGEGRIEAVGSAKLYLLTAHLPGAEPKSKTSGKGTLGEGFDVSNINGVYKLQDDGRRMATVELKVDADGNITGSYTSEKSGQGYEVTGKITPTMKHQIQFSVKFPKTEQQFTAWVFTKDASGFCGFTKLSGQEFGFFATRQE